MILISSILMSGAIVLLGTVFARNQREFALLVLLASLIGVLWGLFLEAGGIYLL